MLASSEDHLLDNGGPTKWPFERFSPSALNHSVADRFEAVARLFPARPAVSDGIRSLTYAELLHLVEYLAEATAALVVSRPGPVAILLPHEARFPAAILAVLAAGRGCIPLDVDDPMERVRLIAAHASASAVVSAGGLALEARRLFPDLPILDIETTDAPRAKTERPKADALAYIIYTSGSTGTPKGVYQNHSGLLHDIMQCTDTQHISCEDRLALFNSPTNISGLRISLSALLNGASLHVLHPRELQPARLVREIRSRGITIFRSVPSLFRYVVEALGHDETLDSVRLVILGGDRVDWRDFEVFKRACPPEAHFGVHLGATECSTLYLQWYVDESMPRTGLLPVGRCVPERNTLLLHEDGRPVLDGEIGEFVVSSRHLALGYWQASDLTTRAFSIDPIDSRARVFRTGDLGRRRSDGLFEHVGRKDDQIKLHGRRIEPAEIESVLREFHQVRDSALVVRRTEGGVPRLMVAYVEPTAGVAGFSANGLTSALARRLPAYMLPSAIVPIDELPRLPNFKIDRVRLAGIEASRAAKIATSANDPFVRDIADIFERAIGTVGAIPEDNLTSLGGDSLQAIKIALELEKRFSVTILPENFNPTRSIRDLARWIASKKARSKSSVGG